MSEVCRAPLKLTIGDVDYSAFDEDHTLSDIVRYLLTQTDREEIAYLVGSVK